MTTWPDTGVSGSVRAGAWRRVVGAAWPLVFLLAFAGTFRRVTTPAEDGLADVDCDSSRTANLDALERCLARDPGDVHVMVDLASAYEASGRMGEAEALYRRAVRTDPRDGESRLHLGEFLLKRGRSDEARTEAEAALRVQPRSPEATRLAARAIGSVAGDSR